MKILARTIKELKSLEHSLDLARLCRLQPIDDDFSCWNPDEMNYDLMKDAAKYYKETPEGVAYMCRTFEEIRKEGIEQGIEQGIAQGIEQGIQQGIQQGIEQGIEQGAEQARIDSIRNLMDSLKMTAQQAMEVLKIPASEQSAYAAKL